MRTVITSAAGVLGLWIAAAAALGQTPTLPAAPPPYNPHPVLSADLGQGGNENFTGIDDTQAGQLCYMLYAGAVQNPTGAFIGDAKTNNSVVALQPPKGGTSGDCANIGTDLAKKLVDHPENYSVYVASAAYPGGRAAEGRLMVRIPDKTVGG